MWRRCLLSALRSSQRTNVSQTKALLLSHGQIVPSTSSSIHSSSLRLPIINKAKPTALSKAICAKHCGCTLLNQCRSYAGAGEKKCITVHFLTADGERITAKGKEGDTLLDVVVNHELPIDGYGACEGTLACSTCHVIMKKEDFEKYPDQAVDEELDMLDLAFELSDTSRLGCQIVLSEELDGLEIKLPAGTADARGS